MDDGLWNIIDWLLSAAWLIFGNRIQSVYKHFLLLSIDVGGDFNGVIR